MPNENNSELIQFISEKFDEVGEKFEKFENHMSEKFAGADRKVEKLEQKMDSRFDELQTSTDRAVKHHEDNKKEIVSMGNRVERSERNIVKLAEATDTEIEQ
ncbi:MAG: hypothetical protein A2919_02485 [Candidatus Spechtbacteria bacterium RIFCSPLOWO2_01_FULL_43_12]|uniref:Uncharacterized protein n=1 Tax=Candidatus Spechtbacteria bacterium RIFCSPLOWO2_01_FULL_43_12 TaxID=1802162 RepID=A0A1G2HF29_9BACT|nr:MAG: hypothetical protein A2919_02485 [Candidatus Spechtbacteria bacterium RIFCSPLOWO2_01_FULL_43_12]